MVVVLVSAQSNVTYRYSFITFTIPELVLHDLHLHHELRLHLQEYNTMIPSQKITNTKTTHNNTTQQITKTKTTHNNTTQQITHKNNTQQHTTTQPTNNKNKRTKG
jgi:hypothetical protein